MSNKYLEKLAVTLELYKKPGAKNLWIPKGTKPEEGYTFTGIRFHKGKKKPGQNLSLVKVALDTLGELKVNSPMPTVSGIGVKHGKMPKKDTPSTYSPDSPVKSTVELAKESLKKVGSIAAKFSPDLTAEQLEKLAAIFSSYAQGADNSGDQNVYVLGKRQLNSRVKYPINSANIKLYRRDYDVIEGTGRIKKFLRAVKGEHGHVHYNGAGLDDLGRLGFQASVVRLQRKDFKPGGYEKAKIKLNEHLDVLHKGLLNDPGRSGVNFSNIKKENHEFFDRAYKSTKKARRNLKIGAGISTIGVIGAAAYGINKLKNRNLEKQAYARSVDLQEQQQRVVDKLDQDHPRLIAFHSLGSGKTLTALRATESALKQYPDEKVTIITPASLVKNVTKDADKHKIKLDSKRVRVMSYQKAVNQLEELKKDQHSLLILDEAHKLRNEDSAGFQKLKPLVHDSRRVLLLSGSPMYNKPKDLGTLINLAAGKKVLPTEEQEFNKAFTKKVTDDPGLLRRVFLGVKPGERTELKNTKVLEKAMKQYVDFHDSRTSPTEKQNPMFPKVTEKEVEVPMSEEQQRMYQYYEGNLPAPLRWKIRMGIMPNKTEAARLNSFASALRQISNSHHPFTKDFDGGGSSPKIDTAVSNLIRRHNEDKNFKGLVYSNYLASGLNPYSKALQTAGIKHGVFTGQLTAKEKAKMVEDYNAGKIKALLVSSSGAEGLDLKGTKLVQILEPHFNDSKVKQVIGRGARFKSHTHLPLEERKVEVERYLSKIRPKLSDKILGIKSKSIDEYLHHYSKEKNKVSDQIRTLAESSTKED